MTPEIRAYLDEHGGTYTSKALRQGLIDAGHDPAEVDAAIAEWEAVHASGAGTEAADRRRFSRTALLLHVGAFAAVIGVAFLVYGARVAGYLGIAAIILAVILAVGWGISAAIGRALLSRTGLTIALVLPVISALLIGGTCYALVASLAGPPLHEGTMTLETEGDLVFSGSGTATCQGEPGSGSMNVFSDDLGTADGRTVRANVSTYLIGYAQGSIYVGVSLGPIDPNDPNDFGLSWGSDGNEEAEVVDLSDSRLSGTVTFSNLGSMEAEQGPEPDRPAVDGTISCECE